jgi:sporulation protein YlmC with PRC-barrel domain
MPPNNDLYYAAPLVVEDEVEVSVVKHRSIPLHELAISRGAKVHDAKGHKVGQVDEFIVENQNGHITHLVLREGHLFGAEDVSIPVFEIEHIKDEDVHLKLTKQEIAALPAIPVKRRWR